jgi:peptidylprolyl isomerase
MRFIKLMLLSVILIGVGCAACSPAETVRVMAPMRDDDGGFVCAPTGEESDRFVEPVQIIDPARSYMATITMADGGQIVLALFPDRAPITVNNFVFLACQGFYDGLTFHRVIPEFMAQGGDPSGDGTGGPGYTIADEHANGLLFDRPGLLSMAHGSRPNSAGSQFFITYEPAPHLNAQFTIFGEVIEGMAVLDGVTPRDPAQPATAGDQIARIRIEEI